MAHTKAEVWAAANAAGLTDGIRAISKAFPGAISELAVSVGGYDTIATSDDLLIDRDRVRPGAGCDADESKRARQQHKDTPKTRYKK